MAERPEVDQPVELFASRFASWMLVSGSRSLDPIRPGETF
jgi:hypothetical protein